MSGDAVLIRTRILFTCFVVAMFDGFDTQSIGFVAPALAHAWQTRPDEIGILFGAGLLGTLIGSLVLGPLADYAGRRRIIAASTFTFGIMSIASAMTSSVSALLLCRLLAGLGLGGAIPNIIALTSEFAPARMRRTAITIMFWGFPLGAIFGGMASAKLLSVSGWQSVFICGGVLPLILLPLLLSWLPESPRRHVQPGHERKPVNTVRALFAQGRAAWTLLLWVVIFSGLLLAYFLVNWTPSLLVAAGLDQSRAVLGAVVLNLGGILGSVLVSTFADRARPFLPLALAFGLGAIAVACMGLPYASAGRLMAVVFLTGVCVLGAQLTMPGISAIYYPAPLRGTGVGWSMGIGRLGSILGPVIGGALLSLGLGSSALLMCAAVPSAVACIAISAMAWRVPKSGADNSAADPIYND